MMTSWSIDLRKISIGASYSIEFFFRPNDPTAIYLKGNIQTNRPTAVQASFSAFSNNRISLDSSLKQTTMPLGKRRLYEEQEGQWLTPVELFRPHYSNILANVVVETCATDRVHIVELGGGRGTNASGILSHSQRTKPKLYDQVSFTIIDSSQPLMRLQKKVLGSGQHAEKIDLVFQDLMPIAEEK